MFEPRHRWPLVLLLAALIAAPAATKPVNLKDWVDGPIRYIAERREMKVFKRLKTEQDRALFIERFWARRDPSPRTLTNEYRQIFWERVQETNGLFLDSHKPGWMTDRGKIYILYGPPTRTEEHLDLDTHTSPTAGHGMIRWYYEGRPGGRTDVNPVVIVPFVRETTGEYRVSYDPKLSSVFFDALAVEEEWDRAIDKFREIFGAPRATEMSVMLDLGRMQEVPPQAQVLLERVETVESYRTHSVDVALNRYVHPEGHGLVAVVTVDVSHIEPGTTPAVIARFRPRDATRAQRMLGEDAFRGVTTARARLVQARIVLAPGVYDLTVLVADPQTAATGMRNLAFTVPESSDRLRLSDLVWAEELEPLEFASFASHDEPFLVGPFRVVPRLGDEFRRGESLDLFYEIYGGTPPYRITYQVEGRDLDGTWVHLGQPATTVQSSTAQGWELPTSATWPAAPYRVSLAVEDDGRRLVEAQVEFQLTDEAPVTPSGPDPSDEGTAP